VATERTPGQRAKLREERAAAARVKLSCTSLRGYAVVPRVVYDVVLRGSPGLDADEVVATAASEGEAERYIKGLGPLGGGGCGRLDLRAGCPHGSRLVGRDGVVNGRKSQVIGED